MGGPRVHSIGPTRCSHGADRNRRRVNALPLDPAARTLFADFRARILRATGDFRARDVVPAACLHRSAGGASSVGTKVKLGSGSTRSPFGFFYSSDGLPHAPLSPASAGTRSHRILCLSVTGRGSWRNF